MYPTQRNLMRGSTLPLLLPFSVISPVVTGQGIDIVTNIKSNTCQSGISSNGNIDLGVVDVGDFTGNISTEDYHPGRKEFTITVQDYTLQDARNALNQLHINFRALSDAMATSSNQIFANEDNAGAENVEVVIFSIQDPANTFSVLSATGDSRSVYPVMSSALNNSSWKFSTQMQKIDPTPNVTSGPLIGHMLMDVYYEQQTKCCRYYLTA